MYGYGDAKQPYTETVELLEQVSVISVAAAWNKVWDQSQTKMELFKCNVHLVI